MIALSDKPYTLFGALLRKKLSDFTLLAALLASIISKEAAISPWQI